MKLLKLIAILLLILMLPGCNDDDDIVLNEDLVFGYSHEIKIPPFKYLTTQGDSVFIRGDISFNSDIIDTVPATPTLSWEKVESEIVCAAIFKSRINVENNSIINDTSDIVWIWHSGLPGGENGLVEFGYGTKKYDPESPESDNEPEPLEQGQVYYWAVWAWDNSGIEVKFSSRELRFVVR
ncbi:MAG: hypothetical protein JSV22_05180 [Bacteroidales bacterium]|nr:MAG: hypothetical protein JSV22_05180 [Bacteroidales bacterium]